MAVVSTRLIVQVRRLRNAIVHVCSHSALLVKRLLVWVSVLTTPAHRSETKFDSGCGWPAFYAEIPGTVDRHVDVSLCTALSDSLALVVQRKLQLLTRSSFLQSTFGMRRVEITCKKCGGHLGHVFENEVSALAIALSAACTFAAGSSD